MRWGALILLCLAPLACESVIGENFERYSLRQELADAAEGLPDAADEPADDSPSPDGPTVCTGTCGSSTACGACPYMVQADLGSFLIDSTEVTQADYAAFLAANVATSTQPSDSCGWNTSFVPSSQGACSAEDFDPQGKSARPAVCVDWCDAAAYCTWARKRLCGGLGGGATAFGDYDKANLSQWHSACTSNAASAYPYATSYDSGACNGAEYQDGSVGATVAVKSAAGCRGTSAPYDGIWDLSGNAAEWEDSCQQVTGQNDVCRARGGSYFSDESQLRCDADFSTNRGAASPTIGLRCCQDK